MTLCVISFLVIYFNESVSCQLLMEFVLVFYAADP